MTDPGDSVAIPRLRVSLPLSHPALHLFTGLLRLTRVLVSSPGCGAAKALYSIGDQITMFQNFIPDDDSSTSQPANQQDPQYENSRHILFGSLTTIRSTIALLHKLNYAEPNDWSKPLPTGRPNELMAILTKRIRVA